MKKSIELLCTNLLLKTGSLIGALVFWYFFSSVHLSTISVAIPICFYSTQENMIIDAPTNINVVLRGQRNHLRSINCNDLAVHIDAQELATGNQSIALREAQLFLPDSIKLVHYYPTPLTISVKSDTQKIL